MATVIQMLPTSFASISGTLNRLHVKGDPELVLRKCTRYLNKNGLVRPLSTESIEALINTLVKPIVNEGLRIICVAYRELDSGRFYIDWEDEEQLINELTCLALLGIEDPVRTEVPDTIRQCQDAGVVVRMVTGDNMSIARYAALKCGIIKPDDDSLLLESKDFHNRVFDADGNFQQDKLDEVSSLMYMSRSQWE